VAQPLYEEAVMPFTSKRQARYMFANHPRIAKKMASGMKGKHPIKGLPESKKVKK
jgi:hypothetical protein